MAVFTWWLFAETMLASLFLGALVWAWGAYLDLHEHNPGRVRSMMIKVLSLTSLCEMSLSASGFTCHWAAVVGLIVNLWGGLDASLRYPAAHDVESCFSVKQCFLLLVKTFSYAFGIVSFRDHVGKLLLVLLVIIWGLPVLYLMALPLDPKEQVAADDRDDVDLVLRVWQLYACTTERQRCLKTCRNWLHRRLFAVSHRSPMARMAICAASPTYRRAFSSRSRRSV